MVRVQAAKSRSATGSRATAKASGSAMAILAQLHAELCGQTDGSSSLCIYDVLRERMIVFPKALARRTQSLLGMFVNSVTYLTSQFGFLIY